MYLERAHPAFLTTIVVLVELIVKTCQDKPCTRAFPHLVTQLLQSLWIFDDLTHLFNFSLSMESKKENTSSSVFSFVDEHKVSIFLTQEFLKSFSFT